MQHMERRKCMACGEPIIGRSDKRYCDDACRNAFNNKRYSTPNSVVRKVNDILKKNRRVLAASLGDEQMTYTSRQKLAARGLDFDFFTNQLVTAHGQTYLFVYEYAYLQLDEQRILVVKQDVQEAK